MDLREKAQELLLKNHALAGGKYIAPDAYHTDQWLWDSCFHAITCAELGLKDLAKNEIDQLLKWQKDDGWIPHEIYAQGKRKRFDIERQLYKKEHRKFHSSITQPPMIAQAVEAVNDPEWTQKILPNLVKFYLYFSQKRDPDGDGLISVCLPTETGRDTSPDFNFCQSGHPIRFLFSLLKLEWQYKKLDWDIDKIWQKDLFNIEDIMFNCIWIDGLKSLHRLILAYGVENLSFGEMKLRELAEHIRKLAEGAEEALIKLCWDEKDGFFYNLDSQNQKIRRKTVSGLFALILNLPREMAQDLVGHLKNPRKFWTPYPVPSVARNDPAFDPHHDFYCNWRGPKWIFGVDWFIVQGLVKHGYLKIAEDLIEKDQALVEKQGFREFYNPLTGKGLRKPTKGFGGSAIVIALPKILENEKRR